MGKLSGSAIAVKPEIATSRHGVDDAIGVYPADAVLIGNIHAAIGCHFHIVWLTYRSLSCGDVIHAKSGGATAGKGADDAIGAYLANTAVALIRDINTAIRRNGNRA